MSAADLFPGGAAPAVMRDLSFYPGFKSYRAIHRARANEVTHLRNGPLGREDSFGRGPLDRVPVEAVSRRPTVNPSFDQVAVDAGVGAAGDRRRGVSENTKMESDRISPAVESGPTNEQQLSGGEVDAFDAFTEQPSNEKSPHSGGQLTRLTDLTVREKGVYVTGARLRAARALGRPLGYLPTPPTTAVKSVKSVKPQYGEGWFSPPCRQTWCQIDGKLFTGVAA